MKKRPEPIMAEEKILAIRETLKKFRENHVKGIMQRTGLSRTTICKYFNDKKVGFDAERKILDASLALIKVYSAKVKKRNRLIAHLGFQGKGNRDNLTPGNL
jgi:hypothetical protein